MHNWNLNPSPILLFILLMGLVSAGTHQEQTLKQTSTKEEEIITHECTGLDSKHWSEKLSILPAILILCQVPHLSPIGRDGELTLIGA